MSDDPASASAFRWELEQEIERLRAQRDEARREVCMIVGGKSGKALRIFPDAIAHAKSRGWDCWKENTP